MTRTSNTKCPTCKKTVKNDDMTAICCEKCGSWYHGVCVSLKIDGVKWLGASRNCVWLCDICISSNIFTNDAKLTSVLESVEIKISTVLENAISKVIAEKEHDSIAIHRRPLNVNESNENIHGERDDSMKLIVAGVPESGDQQTVGLTMTSLK